MSSYLKKGFLIFRGGVASGLFSKRQIHRYPHSDKAGQPADHVGDGLGQKHAVHPKAPGGQKKRQGRHDDDLAKQREKDCLFGAVQGDGHRLTDELKRHTEKGGKVKPEGGNTRGQQRGLTVEDMNKEGGYRHHNGPHDDRIPQGCHGGEANPCAHSAVFPRAVVVAKHRLATVGDARHRHGDDLPHRVDDGHDADVQITAHPLQGGVAEYLHQRVGERHDKAGGTKAENAPHPLPMKAQSGKV